jgi:hypothetical protein
LIQFQQVIETVVKNAWLTGPENMGARERDCGVPEAKTANPGEPGQSYNPRK